jgi:hypothetical protein
MGILRTDRVSGLGGANAIKGSVFFNKQPSSFLRTEIDDTDFVLGTDDFTLELWHNTPTLSTTNGLIMFGPGGYGYYNSFFHFSTADVVMYISSNGSSWDIAQGTKIGERKINTWHHFALTREGNTFRGFVDGVLGATFTSSGAIRQGSSEFNKNQIIIGHRITTTLGHISNFRYIKGRAVYTAAFTPPSYELNVTPDTILLCCQSPSNVLQEATGKTLILEAGGSSNAVSAAENVGPPVATRFTPNSLVGFSTITDVGTQFGSTFDGVTTFDSQAYMVPPGGNTRERNRGRGVISGGRNRSTMEFINIQSQGNSQEFGDSVTGDGIEGFAVGSSTRGLFSGPQSPLSNVIEFITFASQSNGTDFGDTTSARRSGAGAGNETRGLFAGGIYQASSPYGGINITDFVTIATAGNATDFGDLNTANEQAAPNADTTRVVIAGGTISGGNSVNNIDFFTIATTGNATDFGDMTTAHGAGAGGASSSTRGLIAGGVSPDKLNTIQFITIQTTGNSSEYGDLTSARGYPSGMSNSIRGVFAGGYEPTQVNTIDFVNIATTSNAIDFGDLSLGVNFVTQATSDSHGGL